MRLLPSLLIIGLVYVESTLSADFWALIGVGSKGWANYRHQADACHAYHVMLDKGIPAEKIVVMMYDDIANNTKLRELSSGIIVRIKNVLKRNETPGEIFNRPNGTNVYEGVSIDYKGENVSVENFIRVLTGNKTAMNGIGTGRVVNSSENSTIFITIIGQGGQGMILFPDDELKASTLKNVLEQMNDTNKFGKIVFYIESSDAGSLFEGVIPTNNSIIAVTASDENEPSYATYCIKYTNGSHLCLGDEFSVTWMEHVDELGEYETVFSQYEYVREKVTSSHVSIYGDLTMGTNVFSPSKKKIEYKKLNNYNRIKNQDMALFLTETPQNAGGNVVNRLYQSYIVMKRNVADNIINELVHLSVNGNGDQFREVDEQRNALNSDIIDCYDNLVTSFGQNCFKWTEHPYFLRHLYKFVNICTMDLDTTTMLNNMSTVCASNPVVGVFE